MASELNKIKQEIYDTYKDSKYLTMSDDDLTINLYRTDKYKDKFSSLEEFKVYINEDIDKKRTPLEDRKSPYNSSHIEKVQESLFGALPDQSPLGLAPESFRKTIGAIVPNVAQSIGSIVTSVDDYVGGVIPTSVREGAADYSTSLATLLAGKSQIKTKVDPETGSKIGVVNPNTSGLGTVVREIGEFTVASPFRPVGVLTDVMKAKKLKKIQEKIPAATRLSTKYNRRYDIGKYLVAGEIGSQVSMTPEEAILGSMLGDLIGDDKGMLTKLVDYVSADANKTEGENRIALLFDGVFSAGLVGVGLRIGGQVFRSSKDMFNYFKNFKNTASAEKKTEFIETVKTTIEESPISTKTPKELRGAEDDEVLELWRFSDNPVVRGLDAIWGGFFRSEGTLTPKAYKMMNLSKNAQVAWAAKGEYLMTSINSQIKTIAQSVDNTLNETQLDDLFDGYLFGGKEIATLPESLRKTAKETRDTIDEISEMIGQSRGVDPELRKAIKNNLGSYLRTTYKKFEDPNYTPSQEVQDSAVDFIYGKYLKSAERANGAKAFVKKDYPNNYKELLKKQAEGAVNNILRDAKYSDDFFQFANTINAGKDSKIIFDKKKNIAKEIQNLLGKEDTTSARVFSTINTLSDFLYKQNSFEKFRIFGENKYLFPENMGPVGQFNVQIKGKQFGALDGMWTTDTMSLNFLQPLAVQLNINNPVFDKLGSGIKLMYATKGFSQASKTVLNNVTHERNFQSSALIMVSNGLNPFSGLSKGKLDVWEPIQVAWNNVTKGTDEDLVNLYNKYLRLGITNQNAKIGDIRALIKSAEKTGVAGYANKILDASLTEGGLSIRKGYKGIERAYVAEDDIWKIAVFEKELDTLRKAFPNRTIADLEQQAADLVRNTMPTYDMVPAAYKLLRYSPVGNYFSFHAERFRNTYHTYKQAAKEISSDNKVLNTRGWQRLGAKTTVGGFGGLGVSYGSLQLSGVGEDEDKYIKNIMKKDYHGNNWVYDTHDKTGDLLFVDTKYIDPDAPVNDAFLKPFIGMIGTGNVVEEELDNKIIESFTNSLSGVLSPFISETILTGAIFDLTVRKGIDAEGFEVPGWNKTKNKTFETRMNNVVAGFQHIYKDAIEPAVINNMRGIKTTSSGKEDKYGFKKSLDLEVYRNITGFNYVPINDKNLLKQLNSKLYVFKSEKKIARDIIGANYDSLRNNITEKDLYDQFLDGNKQYYRQYVNTFSTVYGIKELMRIDNVRESKGTPKRYNLTDDKIRKTLKDSGLSKIEINEVFNYNYATADFVPLKVSKENLDDFMAMHPDADRNRIEDTLENMVTQLQRLPLLQLDDEYTKTEREALEFLKSDRVRKVEGGLVGEETIKGPEVSYVKTNPSERINEYTGEPYQRTAKSLGGVLVKNISKAFKGGSKADKTVTKLSEPLSLADSIKAYHGTASDFDKFSTDFLKTGEGANAFGKGLYFTETEFIAEGYKEGLTRNKEIMELRKQAQKLKDEHNDLVFKKDAYVPEINPVSLKKERRDPLVLNKLYEKYFNKLSKAEKEKATSFQEKINNISMKEDSVYRYVEKPVMFKGNMFEVNIKTTNKELLDWDKTIGKQSAKVQDATDSVLSSLDADELEVFMNLYGKYPTWTSGNTDKVQMLFDAKVIADDLKAGDFLLGINRLKKSKNRHDGVENKIVVEDILAEQGIKGIKYNDGITRNKKGDKKNNYVIFDARIIDISRKYGITIPAAAELLMKMDSEMKDDTKLQMEKLVG